MADKTPVRVVFNASDVATGLAEFQSGESIGTAFGGTGLTSIGSAGQILKVNAAGSALEFAAEGDVSITNLVAPTNADLTFTTSGTGNIVLDAITVRGTTLSAADSSTININEGLIVDGTLNISGQATLSGLAFPTSDGSANQFLKTDGSGTLSFADVSLGDFSFIGSTISTPSNADLTLSPSGTGGVIASGVTIRGTSISSADSTTINFTDNIVIDGNLTVEGTLDFQDQNINNVGSLSLDSISGDADSNTSITFSGSDVITMATGGSTAATFNADQSVTVSGALVASTSINIASDGATVTGIKDEDDMASDSNVKLATQQSIKAFVESGTSTLTNKTLTNPTINGGTFSGTFTGDINPGTVTTNNIVSNGSNADINLDPTGTGAIKLNAGTTITTTTTDDSLLVTTTEASNSAAPVVTLKRDSSSPANADYIGRIKFKGENDADQEVQYASISGKIIDVADGSEDGAVEFNVKKAGSNNIAARLSSTELKLLNGTTLDVDGAGTFAGVVTATSVTANDFTSNGSNADITIAPQGTGDINLTAGADVNIPANIGITFGDDGEKIEGDGTDLTIASSNDLNLTATTDINVPANVGMTFGDDGEKIEGNGTNLTIATSGTLEISNTGTMNVSGAVQITGTTTMLDGLTAESLITNSITSNGSNADLSLQPSGTGDVLISSLRVNGTTLDSADSSKVTIAEAVDVTGALTFSGLALPTSDGTSGQAIVTDGSGSLSFGTVSGKSASDDGAALVITDKRITSTARTVDVFHNTFQDSVLYYVVSNDHFEDLVNVQKVSVAHNNTGAFVSSAGLQSKASTTMTAFTVGLDNDMIRLKAASSNAVGGTLSFYKIGLGDNTSAGTSGNVIITQNTDVDSASESIVSFAHATFRGAKLFVSVNNDSKTEISNFEALVVHDGSEAFITQFGGISSGSNELLTLTAAISGDNVVISGAGLEPNLRVTVHAIMLKDSMTSNDGTFDNAEAFAAVTVSSTATEVDTLAENTNNGAVYYVVSKNATEGEYAVNEVFLAMGSGEITVASAGFVSTKGTNQLTFTSDYKDDNENLGQLLASSTSGGSTTVSGYRINLLAK